MPEYLENRKLDPVRALKIYLKRVAPRRGEEKSLLIRFGRDLGKATPQSIARWLVTVIERAQGRMTREAVRNATTGHCESSVNILRL